MHRLFGELAASTCTHCHRRVWVKKAREERREQLTTRLSEIFASADTEGDGSLTRDAFMDIFASPYQVRRLQRAVNQPLADIKRVFDWLDIEGKGRIGFREFCEGDVVSRGVTMSTGLRVIRNEIVAWKMSYSTTSGRDCWEWRHGPSSTNPTLHIPRHPTRGRQCPSPRPGVRRSFGI